MKLIDFISQFPDEQACRSKFKQYRDKIGVTCPKCGSKVHYWIGGKSQQYECKCCGRRQTLRANTILHNSHATYREWFIACHLLTSTKANLSVAEIQRQLGRKYWHSVWVMVSRLRRAMGRDDDRYKLTGTVEIDEAFFKLEPIKNEHTREHLTPVLVMAESEESSDKKLKIHRKFGHLKMKVARSISAAELKFLAVKHIEPTAQLRSDGTRNHNYMKSSFRDIFSYVLNNPSDAMRILPWAHLSIGGSKNSIRAIYHDVTRDYLQLYLDEYCWKKNNRFNNLFDRLLVCCVSFVNDWYPTTKFNIEDYLAKNSNRFI